MNRSAPVWVGCIAVAFLTAPAAAQDAAGYRTPPAPIQAILDTPPAPSVSVSPDQRTLAFLAGAAMPTVAELAEPELRLAGVRINPRTNAPSRASRYVGLAFEPLEGGTRREVRLPEGARFTSPEWSPDGTRLAFGMVTPAGTELWVAEARSGEARRLTGPELNATLGSPLEWLPDGSGLVVKLVPAGRGAEPAAPAVPSGPVVQESRGRAAPTRTYEDLLADAHDERLFEHYFTSRLARVPLSGGAATPIGEAGIISTFSVSPDGEYLLATRVKRPFSYLVPYGQFAAETSVLDLAGNVVRRVADRAEVTPSPIGRDMVEPGPRRVAWRSDAPATLVWAEAADGGNARRPAPVRDRVLLLAAPFTGEPVTLAELDQRFSAITWGRSDLALLSTRWAGTARTRTLVVDPSRPGAAPRVLWDRSSEAAYGNPGTPVTTRNAAGRPVLRFSSRGDAVFLTGEGASERGNYPFLDRLELGTGRTTRLWRSADPHYETAVALLDSDGKRVLTRRESQAEAPNYFVRDLGRGRVRQVTRFADPAPQMAGIRRELVTYRRADGVPLSATLYTPAGYDAKRDGPLPMFMWAYPREFLDPEAAGQVTDSPNRFTRPTGASHRFLRTQGYAVLDGPTVPIVGAAGREPNDTSLEQLVASMRAAVDRVVELGVAERGRIGVGG
ncbi:MAG TPA: hypothetical protein VF263_23730, partial [Longimicrobiaceae bacterium]